MKPSRKRTLVLLTAALALVILVCNWPSAAFRTGLYWISLRPTLHFFGPSSCHFNTYDDNVTSATLLEFYRVGCVRLDHLRGINDRRTYRAQNQEGYPSICSVVQYPEGYVVVSAYEGNDSQGIILDIAPGTFPPTDNPRRYLHLSEVPKNEEPGFLKGIP
jgi:hypothetical protein